MFIPLRKNMFNEVEAKRIFVQKKFVYIMTILKLDYNLS